ncbi:MAG: T9SS type A sorting domain-containing protein [Rubricoccaceae bacterium]|nr:T9SS type A sorting domain-containing protein [Rubricoccaceae bacterium]
MVYASRLSLAALLGVALAVPVGAQSARSSHAQHERAAVEATPAVVRYARGGVEVFTDRASFEAACPSLPTEDYEEAVIAAGGDAAFGAPLDTSTDNDFFDPGDILPGLTITSDLADGVEDLFLSGSGFGGAPSVQVGNNSNTEDLVLSFDPGVDSAGLDYDLNFAGTPTVVTAFDASGAVLGSVTSASGFDLQFFGVKTTDGSVASIVFSTAASVEWVDTDNIAFGDKDASCDIAFVAGPDIAYDAGTRRLTITGSVRNDGTANVNTQLFLDYNRAGGPPQGTRGIGSGSLPPNITVPFTINITVPAAAPDGDYNLTLRLRDNDQGLDCATYVEVITISAPRVGAGQSGELFEVAEVADFSVMAEASADAPVAVAPNPFARQTTISYEVAAAADVRLAVYDVLGREVAVLVDGRVEAGTHSAVFDAGDLAAGTYVYRLQVGTGVRAGRMTLAR